jgi:hypothetical protein
MSTETLPYWETLPTWFWIVNYLFWIMTFGTALFRLVRKKIIRLSIIAIVFAITVPIIGLVNSIGRAEGLNEFEHLLNQLQQGAIWSIYVITGYLYALVWWILFFLKSKNKQVGTL